MDERQMVYAASYAIGKHLDYETLMYSDEMYGKEDCIDDVWEYVTECEEMGKDAFRERYSSCKLYCGF